jgi:hypothetical protein
MGQKGKKYYVYSTSINYLFPPALFLFWAGISKGNYPLLLYYISYEFSVYAKIAVILVSTFSKEFNYIPSLLLFTFGYALFDTGQLTDTKGQQV